MRCSLRNPLTVWKPRLFRNGWYKNSSLLFVFVSAYVCLFLYDAGRILTSVMLSGGSPALRERIGDPMGLANITQKIKSVADINKLKHIDLSIAFNDVRFRENRRKLLCFEWDLVKEEIENQIRSEQEQPPEGESRPSDNPGYDAAENKLYPKLLRMLGDTGNDPMYPYQAKTDELTSKSDTDKSEELGLLAPVSPSTAILKALYRRAISHAVEVIKDAANDEPITSCAFPGFSQEESELIWVQASRGVRIQHTCGRYTAFQYLNDTTQNVLWNPIDNFGYCHQMTAGPNSWQKFLLEWAGEKVDSATAGDDVAAETRLRKLYPPLPRWRMAELRARKPLLFTVVENPIERIVSAYVNLIKRHYRYKSSPAWIREVRGKTFQELINGIRKNILESSPALARNGILNELLAPVRGFGKHNKVRRHGNSTDTRLNFREFVWLAIKQNLECFNDIDCLSQLDPHWLPQYIGCSPCSLSFDIIIKDETFQRDSNFLLKLLGKPLIPDPENASNRSTDPVTVPSQSDTLRNATSIKTSSNSDGSSTSIPAFEERKQVTYLNVTSSNNGSDNTAVNDKHEEVGEVDPYDIVEGKIDEDLPIQDLAFEYTSYLTDEEVRMLYVTYSYDFTVLGYNQYEY